MKAYLLYSLCLAAGIIILMQGVTGCESSDSSSPHDFGENDPNTILSIGDSITSGYGVSSAQSYPVQLAGLLARRVINAGREGERSWEGRARFENLLDRYKPGYALILYGANDVIYSSTSGTVENLRQMIRAAQIRNVIPVVATLTPANRGHSYMQPEIANQNPRIRAMVKEEKARLADLEAAFSENPSLLQSDGLHPNPDGMRVIAFTFFDKIDE